MAKFFATWFKSRQPASEKSLYQDFSDKELIDMYQNRPDPKLVAELLHRYSGQIAGICLGHFKNDADIEDLAQEVFLKIVEKLKSQSIQNFKAWLYSLVRNMIIDQHRKNKKVPDISEIFEETDENVEKKLMDESEKLRLSNTLKLLNEHERNCIDLIYLQEKSYHEVMQTTGLTFNQLRGLRDRAIRKLRQSYKKGSV